MELPAIEEAADKENDTFAQGGPIAALHAAVKLRGDAVRANKHGSNSQASSRLMSAQNRSQLRSADPSPSGKDNYRMYRAQQLDKQKEEAANLARNC